MLRDNVWSCVLWMWRKLFTGIILVSRIKPCHIIPHQQDYYIETLNVYKWFSDIILFCGVNAWWAKYFKDMHQIMCLILKKSYRLLGFIFEGLLSGFHGKYYRNVSIYYAEGRRIKHCHIITHQQDCYALSQLSHCFVPNPLKRSMYY